MTTLLRIEIVPPAGAGDEEADPAVTEIEAAGPPPAPGARFAFVDGWGRAQRGRVLARSEGADGVVTLTVEATPAAHF